MNLLNYFLPRIGIADALLPLSLAVTLVIMMAHLPAFPYVVQLCEGRQSSKGHDGPISQSKNGAMVTGQQI